MKPWRMFVGVIAVASTISFRTKAGDVPDGQRWWSHVAVLADDKLEGRNTGSEGHRKAAEYVASGVRAVRARARRHRGLLPVGAFDVPGNR